MPVRFAAFCFGLLLALGGCAAPTVAPPPTPVQPPVAEVDPAVAGVRVAMLVPLSGPAQALGEDMLQAAQMALFDVGENDLVLLPRDTAGTPEGAAAAARAALQDGADLIIGPLYRAAVPAVTETVRAAQPAARRSPPEMSEPAAEDPTATAAGEPRARGPVKVLAFSNAADVAAPGVYLLGFRPEEQVERVVDFALSQGLRRIAALAPDDAYGRLAMTALREAVVRGGGELGPTRFYPPSSTIPNDIVRDLAGVDERLRGREDALGPALPSRTAGDVVLGEPPFDAILLADGGNRLRGVASLLAYYGIDPDQVRFLGTWRWQDEDPEALADAGLEGGWFAAPSPDGMDAFKRRFATAFGHEPEPLAALAYDATALAAIVARDLGDPSFSTETLTTAQGFLGASGPFRLRSNGLAEHGLAVLEVGRGGALRVVSEPPATFAPEVAVR